MNYNMYNLILEKIAKDVSQHLGVLTNAITF